MSKPKPNAQETLAAAIRSKIEAILDGGITVRSMMQVEQTAKHARHLLAVGTDAEAMANKSRRGSMVVSGSAMYASEDDAEE